MAGPTRPVSEGCSASEELDAYFELGRRFLLARPRSSESVVSKFDVSAAFLHVLIASVMLNRQCCDPGKGPFL